jgi:Arm DNA-binding domain
MKLTQANIDQLALPPGKIDVIFFDDDLPGFGLRLRAGGSRGYVVQYALGIRSRRMTIGTTKILTLEKARETARNILARARLGHDPAAERDEARARASDHTLGASLRRVLKSSRRLAYVTRMAAR